MPVGLNCLSVVRLRFHVTGPVVLDSSVTYGLAILYYNQDKDGQSVSTLSLLSISFRFDVFALSDALSFVSSL